MIISPNKQKMTLLEQIPPRLIEQAPTPEAEIAPALTVPSHPHAYRQKPYDAAIEGLMYQAGEEYYDQPPHDREPIVLPRIPEGYRRIPNSVYMEAPDGRRDVVTPGWEDHIRKQSKLRSVVPWWRSVEQRPAHEPTAPIPISQGLARRSPQHMRRQPSIVRRLTPARGRRVNPRHMQQVA